jgi:hypothetical protein
MLLIIVIIMICYSYSMYQIGQVVSIGGIIILCMYLFSNKKEMFSQVTYKMEPVTPFSVDSIPEKSESLTPLNNSIQVPTMKPMYQMASPMHQSTPMDIQQTVQTVQTVPHIQQTTQIPVQQTVQMVSPVQQVTPIPILYQTSQFNSGYQSQESSQPINNFTPHVGVNQKIYRQPVTIAPRIMDPQFTSVQTNFPVDTNPVQDLGGMSMPTYQRSNPNRVRRPGLLLDRTPSEQEVTEAQMRPYRMFIQDVEPNVFSFTNERTPINANLGISSTPQIPQLRKEVFRGHDGRAYPMYSRIDPQLVRDNVPDERRQEMPRRNDWSDELPGAAPNNSIYSIYDPRFTGYGDANRSYYDVNLGQIKYYYSDVDAYKSPNFIIRNKVDHVDMIDPMDRVYSEYPRTASLEDVNDTVHDDWLAKSTEFREDMMEKIMRKNNSQSWQLRMAPHSKGSRLSTFSSRY